MTGVTGHSERDRRIVSLLEPRSIAVVGASDRPGPSRNVISNLRQAGFSGQLYLINPRRDTVAGLAAYPSLGDLPESCDLVVAAVNRETTVEVVEEAAELGCRGAVLLAAGFGETGAEGALLQARLAAKADDLALLGPNCLGFANLEARVAAYSGPLMQQPEVGRLAMVSNSGAIACTVTGAAAERGLLFSHVITTGNQVDLRAADIVGYLAGREAVDVIACYLEGFDDGRGLLRAFAAATAAGKKVVVLKSGRTKAGGEAARTHTGVLAGSSTLQESLFGQIGVLMAKDIEEFLAMIEIVSRFGVPSVPGVGVVTISGGERLLMADASEEAGLELAVLSAATEVRLGEVLPQFAVVSNPLDTTGAGIVEGETDIHGEAVAVLAGDPGVGLLVACQDAKNGWIESAAASQMFLDAVMVSHLAAEKVGKPLVVVSPTCGAVDARARRYMIDNAIPFLAGLVPSIGALAKVLNCGKPSPGRAVSLFGEQDVPMPGSRLTGAGSFERLSKTGVQPWPYALAASETEALAAARQFGFPVALKLDGTIAHRSEIDGVRLFLGDDAAVRHAWSELSGAAASAGIVSVEVLVQPMAPRGLEVFVGGVRDPQFGPVVLVGPGGAGVEEQAVFAGALAPLDAAEALELLRWAHLPPTGAARNVDFEALADSIAGISTLTAEADVQVLDVNPVIALDRGVAVIDAKLVVDAAAESEGATSVR